MIKFEWDENKNQLNRKKHGVWFEEAQSVFDDDKSKVFLDPRDYVEDRFIILGFSKAARLLVVTHCYREKNEVIRIISARKATKQERLYYEKRI